MKNIKILSLLLILVLISSCQNEEDFAFKMAYFHDLQLDPTQNNFETHYFTYTNQATNVLNIMSNFDQDVSNVELIKPFSATLSSSFSSVNLIFIQNIEIGLFLTDPTDNSDFKLIFYRDNIQSTQNGDIQLFPSLLDVKDLLTDNLYNIAIKIEYYSNPPEFIDCRLSLDFGVVNY